MVIPRQIVNDDFIMVWKKHLRLIFIYWVYSNLKQNLYFVGNIVQQMGGGVGEGEE